MTIEARRMRGVGAILLALALTFVAAVPSAMADTIYPDNKITGTSFDAGLDGWTEFSNDCNLIGIGLPQPVCQTRTVHVPGIGTPPGALEQNVTKAAGALTLIRGRAVALSPEFLVGQGLNAAGNAPNPVGTPFNATFQFDLCAVFEGVLDIGAEDIFQFNLIDVANNTRQELLRERRPNVGQSLPNNCSAGFSGRLNDGLPTGVVIAGRTYRIELISNFNTAVLSAALDRIRAYFDNIRLRVEDGTPFLGPPSVITDPATNIKAETATTASATLNGRVNANGIPTTFVYRYATNQALNNSTVLQDTNPVGPFNGGQLNRFVARPRNTGPVLANCTTYFFRIEASNTQGTSLGNIESFRTPCAPTAVTTPAFPAPQIAELRSEINPQGAPTSYFYEYGLDNNTGTFTERVPVAPNSVAIGDGTTTIAPNSQLTGPLQPLTAYHARVVAVNIVGTTVANEVKFTTPGLGLTGPQGPAGQNGTNGTNGVDGAVGPQGATGAPGAQGVPGPTGAAGPVGARGPAGQTPNLGSSIQDLLSTNALAMIRIDATRLRVPMRGRDIGRVRVQIFCRPVAVRTCSGNMKVRSINKINPASTGTRPARRVTFATDAVQLDVRKIGFGILNFNAQRRAVIRRQKSIRASVIVSVIDAANNRQNVRRNVTIVAGR
ncbi:MAG TPA: collagen-like protein [Solirubrobacteraceae bacterium]|nr:collagen-like protein [Solirubrobacteraceae bacterium]